MRLFCPSQNRRGSFPVQKENGISIGGPEKMEKTGMEEMDRIGLYQGLMIIIVSIPLLLSAGFTISYVFTVGEIKYRCLIPECENTSNTILNPPWVNYSAPHSSGNLETCTRYVVNNETEICSTSSFTNETQGCSEWVFDPDESTIMKDFKITCDDNRWKITFVGTLNNIGQFVGLIFIGQLSDRFGRRTVLTLLTLGSGITGIIQSFSTNYWMFLCFEFIDAIFASGIYSAGFLLGMEMFGIKGRALGGTIVCVSYAVGEIYLGLVAMWLGSWRSILRMIYGPAVLAVFLLLNIPESVRWLLAHGKHDEVEKIFRKMASMNGIRISDEAIYKFKEVNIEQEAKKVDKGKSETERSPISQIFRSRIILIRVLAACFCWLTNTFVYYGLSLNSVSVAGDKYMNFISVAAIEIPAYFLTWLLTDRIGRKPTLCGAFLLSGAFCLAIQFVPTGAWKYLPLVLFLGGKGCITVAFSTVYIYTVEMFPTELRHSLMGFCSMIGRIGSILAPQTPLLAVIMESLPLILFGTMAVLAGIMSFIFPETLGRELPDTVQQAERIGKEEADEKDRKLSI